jgi:hypothetical protein
MTVDAVVGVPMFFYVVGVFVAVSLTLSVAAAATDNPSSIPWVAVWRRAAFGLLCSFVAWFGLATLLCWALEVFLLRLQAHIPPAACIAVGAVVGVVVPEMRLAQRLVRQSWYGNPVGAALAKLLVSFSEATRIYPDKIVTREERKIADKLLSGGLPNVIAISKLYEFHLVGIILHAAKGNSKGRRKAATLALLRNPAIKLRYLMRYLGAFACAHAIDVVAADNNAVLPGWTTPDRRAIHDRRGFTQSDAQERRCFPFGRRKFDSPSAAAVLSLDVDYRTIRQSTARAN